MSSEGITYEVASLLEAQGYYDKAMDYYGVLLEREPDREDVTIALKRVESLIAENRNPEEEQEKKIAALFDTLSELLLLKQRIDSLTISRRSIA